MPLRLDQAAELAAVKKMVDSCRVRAVETQLPPLLIEKLPTELQSTHHWDGAAVLHENHPVLAFKLHDETLAIANYDPADLFIFPYGWCIETGAVLSVTLGDRKGRPRAYHPRIFVHPDNPTLTFLERGHLDIVLYHDNNLLRRYAVDFEPGDAAAELATFCQKVRKHVAPLRNCKEATFFSTLAALKSEPNFLRPEDKLAVGWARSYVENLRLFNDVRTVTLENLVQDKYHGANLPPIVREFFEDGLRSHFDIETVSKYAVAAFDSNNSFMDFAQSQQTVEAFISTPPGQKPGMPCITTTVIRLGLRDPIVTNAGRRVPWIGGNQNGFGYLEPSPKDFPPWFDATNYWDRLPTPLPFWALGALVRPADIPLGQILEPQILQSFPKAEKPAESAAVADTLIEEGLANKHWVIPRHALLQLSLGPFTHFEVTEYDREVFFVGRTNRGEFDIFSYELDTKYLAAPLGDYAFHQPAEYTATIAALRLLFAAVIRDFWVVEEREKVFTTVSVKRLQGVKQRDAEDNTPRVVYLPRIHYKEKPSPSTCADQLDHKIRAAHFVNAHLRKANSASDLQIRLAQRYGFDVPSGYTFVKPHERGKLARAVIYRSRSALQTLYRVDERAAPVKPEWFKFEKDVQLLMEGLGFEVQHKASSRTGDKGVDLYATKGTDIDLVNWVVQCKCYRGNHPVGPEKIRELHGVVCCHPAGTRGMLVTTSYFTKGAHALAIELNIRLMNGDEFLRRLQQTPKPTI